MANEKEISIPQDENNSTIEAPVSSYALPDDAREVLGAWLLAKRLKKYRQMKKLEGGEGLREMPGVARDFYSSSPGDGRKIEETAAAYVVAFEGDAGPEVAFVECEAPGVGETEFEDLDGVPVC